MCTFVYVGINLTKAKLLNSNVEHRLWLIGTAIAIRRAAGPWLDQTKLRRD